MSGLGRQAEFFDVASGIIVTSMRREVGCLIADGCYVRGADLLAGMGNRSFEAYVRLLAGERLLDEGKRRDAETQVRRALALHRSVNATAYVARGERVAAALT